jgi:hypothetical protein
MTVRSPFLTSVIWLSRAMGVGAGRRRLRRGAPTSGELRRTALSLAFACVAATGLTAQTAWASGQASNATYVALGDSYSAGEGLGPFEERTATGKGPQRNTCHRSKSHAYATLSPAVVLPQVKIRGFWACSGATVPDIESIPGRNGTPSQYGQPSQLATVGPSTEYVTLTVGGDDLGFGDIGHACAEAQIHNKVWRFSDASCSTKVAQEEAKIPKLTTELEALYDALLSRSASNSELVVAGYPKVLPDRFDNLGTVNGTPFCAFDHLRGVGSVGMPVPDAQQVASFENQLNGAIHTAVDITASAHPGRIAYADLYPTSVPRNCHGTTSGATVAGVELSPLGHGIGPGGLISTATFHPTKAGQQTYANAVQEAFTNPSHVIAVTGPDTLGYSARLGQRTLPPTLGAFKGAFGKPASAAYVGYKNDPECQLIWPSEHMTAIFYHGYGGLQGGSCVSGSGTLSVVFGSGWRTDTGLAVGASLATLKQIYPQATRHGSTWVLIASDAGWGIVNVLKAAVKNNKVTSLTLSGPEAWDE